MLHGDDCVIAHVVGQRAYIIGKPKRDIYMDISGEMQDGRPQQCGLYGARDVASAGQDGYE